MHSLSHRRTRSVPIMLKFPGMTHEPPDEPVLPSGTSDESDIGWGDQPEPDSDDRLREDRPPHWDTP
jgi:hypothetical protein